MADQDLEAPNASNKMLGSETKPDGETEIPEIDTVKEIKELVVKHSGNKRYICKVFHQAVCSLNDQSGEAKRGIEVETRGKSSGKLAIVGDTHSRFIDLANAVEKTVSENVLLEDIYFLGDYADRNFGSEFPCGLMNVLYIANLVIHGATMLMGNHEHQFMTRSERGDGTLEKDIEKALNCVEDQKEVRNWIDFFFSCLPVAHVLQWNDENIMLVHGGITGRFDFLSFSGTRPIQLDIYYAPINDILWADPFEAFEKQFEKQLFAVLERLCKDFFDEIASDEKCKLKNDEVFNVSRCLVMVNKMSENILEHLKDREPNFFDTDNTFKKNDSKSSELDKQSFSTGDKKASDKILQSKNGAREPEPKMTSESDIFDENNMEQGENDDVDVDGLSGKVDKETKAVASEYMPSFMELYQHARAVFGKTAPTQRSHEALVKMLCDGRIQHFVSSIVSGAKLSDVRPDSRITICYERRI